MKDLMNKLYDERIDFVYKTFKTTNDEETNWIWVKEQNSRSRNEKGFVYGIHFCIFIEKNKRNNYSINTYYYTDGDEPYNPNDARKVGYTKKIHKSNLSLDNVINEIKNY